MTSVLPNMTILIAILIIVFALALLLLTKLPIKFDTSSVNWRSLFITFMKIIAYTALYAIIAEMLKGIFDEFNIGFGGIALLIISLFIFKELSQIFKPKK